jgi:hypothetical protein
VLTLKTNVGWIVAMVVSGLVGGTVVAWVSYGPTVFELGSGTPDRMGDVAAVPNASMGTTSSATSSDGMRSPDGLRVYMNRSGRYGFVHPDGWSVSTHAKSAELRSPGGEVAFIFGPAPRGALPDAAAAVAERYSPTPSGEMEILSSHEETTDQGLRSWLIGGVTRTTQGGSERFLAISIEAPQGRGRNHAIVVRFPTGSALLDLLPEIRRVISSYRIAGSSVSL